VTVHSLDRLIFKTSRLAEFCSRKELTNQTGHGVEDWLLVILKELVDNAIDACEEAGIAPTVEIGVSDGAVAVTDNGDGIAPDTVAEILDFSSASQAGRLTRRRRAARRATPLLSFGHQALSFLQAVKPAS
jgi:DNA topoisomerase VI subunit B